MELARRPSARMSTLSSCALPFASMCGSSSPTGSETVVQPARRRIFSTVSLTALWVVYMVSLIKVEGLFAPYIVSIFDIVNSGTSVQRYI